MDIKFAGELNIFTPHTIPSVSLRGLQHFTASFDCAYCKHFCVVVVVVEALIK